SCRDKSLWPYLNVRVSTYASVCSGCGIKARQFAARRIEVAPKTHIRVQARNHAGADHAARLDVAWIMIAANDAAIAEVAPALQDRIGARRNQFRQHQRPSPAAGAMPGGVGALRRNRGIERIAAQD